MNPPAQPKERAPWWPTERKWQLEVGTKVAGDCLAAYPKRPEPAPFVPVRTAIMALLPFTHPARLIDAARQYAHESAEKDPQYLIGAVRFYRDGLWERYAQPKVFGMTRAQWIQARLDVAEFDALAVNPKTYSENPYADQ